MDALKFDSRRPVVIAEHGAIACADARAALMGLGMIEKVHLCNLSFTTT